MAKKNKPGVQRRVAKNNLTRAAKKAISDHWIKKFYESDDWKEKLESAPFPASLGEIAEYLGAPKCVDMLDFLFKKMESKRRWYESELKKNPPKEDE